MVNGTPLENVPHSFAVQQLRKCGKTAVLVVRRPRRVQMVVPSKSEPALDMMDDYTEFENRTAYTAYSDRSVDPNPGYRRDQERGPYYEKDQRGYGARAKSVDQDLNVDYGPRQEYSRGRSMERGLDDEQNYRRDHSRGRSIDRGLDEDRGYRRERSRGRSLDRDLDDPRSYGRDNSRGRTLDRDDHYDRNAQYSPDKGYGRRASPDRRYDKEMQKSRDRLQSHSPSPSDTSTSVLLTKKKPNEGKYFYFCYQIFFVSKKCHYVFHLYSRIWASAWKSNLH
ncbi:unnamed protein product [Staurois parvus]|uniref:PDZ domain-containing protein n=1 Tax=Staurois parvus TaxID=386267 RepID=A0ABN9C1X5_9NEOB|nr:unnamed protein product [Staurois parvus]